jgi:hypothetical protein
MPGCRAGSIRAICGCFFRKMSLCPLFQREK